MKKIIISVLVLIFSMTICWTQDTIITKSNEGIYSKVLEVTISEIKYKKFDNLEGPNYTILKSEVLMIKYSNGTKDAFTANISNSPSIAKIYVYRVGKYVGSATKVKLYCNDELVCEIPSNSGYACSVSKTGKYLLKFKGGGCFKSKQVTIDVNSEQQEYYVRYDIGSLSCSYSVISQLAGSKEYKELKHQNEITIK